VRAESQVDVAFPFNPELQAVFSKLETDYYTSRSPLAEIYTSLRAYGQEPGLVKYDAQAAVVLSADVTLNKHHKRRSSCEYRNISPRCVVLLGGKRGPQHWEGNIPGPRSTGC
jgi:hypothetical protein